MLTVAALLALAAPLARPDPVHAQVAEAPSDLADLFDTGRLVLDTNGDGVPDRVNATLVLGAPASTQEVAAAAEISARLGFETMAMDLPIRRGLTDGGIHIVVGRSGLAASGLSSPGVDPSSLDAGEGVVAVRTEGGRSWLLILGGDDAGLMAAARLFAGVLPHTRTLSAPELSEVTQDLEWLLEQNAVAGTITLVQARTRAGDDGITRLVATVDAPGSDADQIAAALRSIEQFATGESATSAGDDAPGTEDLEDPEDEDAGGDSDASDAGVDRTSLLAYAGLGSVEVRIVGGSVIRLAGRAEVPRPGPIPGRPGGGGKGDLDLSNVYTVDGFLGAGPIPSRIDVMLAPGDAGTTGLPDLAARLGLESVGLVVPLVAPAASIERPQSSPTLVLTGVENPKTDELADSGRIDLTPLGVGEGLIQLVPDAFGSKSAFVVTGADAAGAERALKQVAETFPNLSTRGRDRSTVDDVERELWDALSGHSPAGQAAIGLYKLDRIGEALSDRSLRSAEVLISVEKADPGLAAEVRGRAVQALGTTDVSVSVDNRDVQAADTIFTEPIEIEGEVARFWSVFESGVLSGADGVAIDLEARLSEPPEVRQAIADEARSRLLAAGARPESNIQILSAFKQGYSWLEEVVAPAVQDETIGEFTIQFRRNDPPEEWPQQAIHTPVRWLHEIFPIDEVLARDLDLDLEQIRFEQTTEGPIYSAHVSAPDGSTLYEGSFEPKWVTRPYFDRFQDYEHVRVTTGWIRATGNDRVLVDERIVTDPEAFWDQYQASVLPQVYDYVMDRHEGMPQGGSTDAPFFGELKVELSLSEPDYRLGIDNEIHAPMDALHEEVYFGTIEFFDLLGRNSRGQGLQYAGRVIPVMRPKGDGSSGTGRVTFTGFATSRPAVVVRYEEMDGTTGEVRLDIPKTGLDRPSARMARVPAAGPGLSHMAFRVRVDTEADLRDSLLTVAAPRRVDQSMVSAAQIEATLAGIQDLQSAGLYRSALSYDGLESIEVWAEWSHEQDPDSRRTAMMAATGDPGALPDARGLLPDGWTWSGERIVQWDEPIAPPEGHEMLAKMASTFDEATIYRAGTSYLGRDIWAMDLMPEISATHWSLAKATTYKPTVVYSARQHANEVSSTSHVLRHAELLLTDSVQRAKLDRVNVIIHPFTNPDGAQLAYDLYQMTPDYILHAGYLGSLGQDATSGGSGDHPIYPESTVRGRLWENWKPDIFLNPHGYPSHQVVQLFSEYTGLVRRGRVTERNWGFNKGWFMPGFGYVDNPRFPRHKDAAFEIRDYITQGINSNRDVFDMNQRNYDRYRRYGADFDPEVFHLPMTDSVLIQMPLKGSSGSGGGYDANITIWSGTTEAPDETAYGPWMELVAKAGLSWDQAILDYLAEANHEVKRSGSAFFGGVTLRMNRPRPAESKKEEAVSSPEPRPAPGSGR